MNRAIEAFDSHGLRAQNDKLLDVQDMVTILSSLYEILAKEHPTAVNLPLNIDLVINWILNIYDRLVGHRNRNSGMQSLRVTNNVVEI